MGPRTTRRSFTAITATIYLVNHKAKEIICFPKLSIGVHKTRHKIGSRKCDSIIAQHSTSLCPLSFLRSAFVSSCVLTLISGRKCTFKAAPHIFKASGSHSPEVLVQDGTIPCVLCLCLSCWCTNNCNQITLIGWL